MHIEIDDKSGFCFGVVRAITEAERALGEGGTVYSLGDIVHNRIEVQRLEALGLRTVTHADMPRLAGCRLFIRAHGEPPTTYDAARRLGIGIIDATCPVVARLQRRVKQAHEAMRAVGGQVVILGKRGHAEVVGLTGQVAEPTVVIERAEDLAQIDFARPIHFLSQTTQSIALFEELGAEMRRRAADPAQVRLDDTICRQVSGREAHLAQFAARFDAVVFVCGRKSSNGKVLYEVCRRANPRCRNIEEPAELDPAWFEGVRSVGICGATSTPKWLMQRVAEAIRAMGPESERPPAPETAAVPGRASDRIHDTQNFELMKRYLIRSLKYFAALCVLCMAIMALNLTTGMASLSLEETLYVMFHTPRGLMLPAVIVLLAAFYPRFGFIVRRVEGDVEEHREQIVNAFRSAGFELRREEDDALFFRAKGPLHRLLLLGEDEIKVSQYGQWIELEGIRRGVARVIYRLDSHIRMARYDKE